MRTLRSLCAAALCALVPFVTSCQGSDEALEQVSLGEAHYHDSFLWTDEVNEPLQRTLCLNFNDDARRKDAEVTISFTDNDREPLSADVVQVFIDGKPLKGNSQKFKANEVKTEMPVSFLCSPSAHDGKHQGYLVVRSASLSAVNSVELKAGAKTEVLQWTFVYDKCMNPLKKGLLIALAVFAVGVILARIVLHKSTFGPSARKSVTVIDASGSAIYGPKTARMGGSIEVVFTNRPRKQGWLEVFFKGKVITVVDPVFVAPIRLAPGKRKTMRIRTSDWRMDKLVMNYTDVEVKGSNPSSRSTIHFS